MQCLNSLAQTIKLSLTYLTGLKVMKSDDDRKQLIIFCAVSSRQFYHQRGTAIGLVSVENVIILNVCIYLW